jgi:hypothetical protein
MSNFLYDVGRRALLSSQVNWANADLSPDTSQTYRCCLIRTVATPGNDAVTPAATMSNMTILSGAIANTAGSGKADVVMTGRAITTAGAADATDVTFSQVTAGQQIGAIVIYKEVTPGTPSANIPIVNIGAATGLPITSNGGDIIIVFDNGVNAIFRP